MEDIFNVAGGHDHTPLHGWHGLRRPRRPGPPRLRRPAGAAGVRPGRVQPPERLRPGRGQQPVTALDRPERDRLGLVLDRGRRSRGARRAGPDRGRRRRLVPAPPARGPAGDTARAGMIPSPVRTVPGRVSAITAEARAGRAGRLLVLLALTLGVLAGCGTAAKPAAAPAHDRRLPHVPAEEHAELPQRHRADRHRPAARPDQPGRRGAGEDAAVVGRW